MILWINTRSEEVAATITTNIATRRVPNNSHMQTTSQTTTNLQKMRTYWEYHALTAVIERWKPEDNRTILDFLKSLLRTCLEEEEEAYSLHFGIKITHCGVLNPEVEGARRPTYTIKISVKEERERHRSPGRATKVKVKQIFNRERLKDLTDVELVGYLKKLEKLNFSRKRVLKKRLQFLARYEAKMAYTEKEDIEWPVVRGLVEMWEEKLQAVTSALRIISEATGRER